MHQMREKQKAPAVKNAAAAFSLSVSHYSPGGARACVHNLSGAIPESSNYFDTRRRSVCFADFITCG
jgi:hypothetical protein